MPGFNIHIAIGNEYIKKNNVKNRLEFLKGVITPDLCDDKGYSHFSGPINKENLVNSLKNKVNLKKFLIENNKDTDYDNGMFLHLLTDFLFYNKFFDKSYLERVNWDKFKNDLYYSLNKCDFYVKKRYHVRYEVAKKEILADFNKYKNYKYSSDSEDIIDINNLNNFINEISSINLNIIKTEILNNKDS